MISHAPLASLRPFNTFGIDAKAKDLCQYSSVDALRQIIDEGELEYGFLCVGSGSNLLFTHDVYPGLVLHGLIRGVEIDGNRVSAGAAVLWDDLVEQTIDAGLSGIENLSGIPGETGSAAVQNIGAYGAELAQVMESVETVDAQTGDIRVFDASECGYSYRWSVFKQPDHKRYIVTRVNFCLNTSFTPNLTYNGLAETLGDIQALTATDVRQAVLQLRASKLPDPAVMGNAGSFFMNPVVDDEAAKRILVDYPDAVYYPAQSGVKLSAGWLIDKAGWKGRSMGRAGVYDKQALVLVNLGGATGREVLALARAIISDVEKKFGVTLQPEVNIL